MFCPYVIDQMLDLRYDGGRVILVVVMWVVAVMIVPAGAVHEKGEKRVDRLLRALCLNYIVNN